MNQQFNSQELNNILALINSAPIKGEYATAVAMLQQKIQILLQPTPNVPTQEKTLPEKSDVPEKI